MERQTILIKITNLLHFWETGDQAGIANIFTKEAVFNSSAHGVVKSNDLIAKTLSVDFDGPEVSLRSSNYFIAQIPDTLKYVFTMYVYGILKKGENDFLVFGATATGYLTQVDGALLFSDFIFSVNWFEGNSKLLNKWIAPKGNRYWQAGDLGKNIVSEIDAPWHKYGQLIGLGTEEELLKQSYAKYAWAIDQADFVLLSSMFSSHACGNFTPMGDLSGKHQIISTMKDFRQPWPYMQHFGEGLRVKIDPDQAEARLIIGRIIPQQYETAIQKKQYGAYYDLTMKKINNDWVIYHFTYNPGWFSDIADIIQD